MKVWKKLSAVTLALVMVLALSVSAFATTNPATLEKGTVNSEDRTGQQGTFTNPDTPLVQEKTVTLAKEITAYNPETTTIKAPTISYTYTITAANVTDGQTAKPYNLTDKADKHADDVGAVTVPVKQGVTPAAVLVAGGNANSEDGATSNSGTVTWESTEDLSASSAGVANYKGITFNFSNIDFGSAGVYRYVVTEAPTAGYAYGTSGVTDSIVTDTNATGDVNTRYIDVYVKDAVPEEGQTLTGANQWVIYGYTCFYNNGTFTDANKNTVAVKTTGFVAGTTDGDSGHKLSADSYYTYNFTVSKTVVNDSYSATTHAFPFTVIFSNTAIKKNVGIITDKTSASNADGFVGTDNVISGVFASELSSNAFDGVLTIKHGETMKYVGIPCGTAIEVYETNDVNGVTYKVDTRVDSGAATTDNAVTSTTKPDTAVAQTTEADYQSTKAMITTTADTVASVVEHSIAITNTLLNISPTGVTLRYAPYLAMMGAGVVALPLTLRKKEEEF